jgi:hypothetical protein
LRRQGTTLISRFAALLLILATVTVGAEVVAPSLANAQDRVVRRLSLFDFFVPRRLSPRYDGRNDLAPTTRPRKVVSKPRKPKTRLVRAAAATEPEIVPVEKRPDARTVMVIGDFLASGLAEGLEVRFAQNAGIRILDRAKGSSGFVRDDVFDWPGEIASMIDVEKPAAIVVMMGSNDRQQMQVADKREAARSDGWTKAYGERTVALAEAIETKKIPLVWVSMPPFKSTKMSSDMLALNDVYKIAAEGGGGQFVDIWDGFADENGVFVSTGPDVNGQPARLRAGDGINFTSAGKVKIAFFAEKPLRKLLGLPAEDGPPALAVPLSPNVPVMPGVTNRTEPIALSDPALDGATELLGASIDRKPADRLPQLETATPVGRADNFMVGAPATAVVPADEATSAVGR